jgi:hypothetical protein
MFCPKCGKADQQENSYCRQCGEFLPDLSRKGKLVFGGDTPEEQIRTNLFLNLLSAVVGLILTILLYSTFFGRPNTPPIIFIVAAFLLAMTAWQLSTFYVGLKLRKSFRKRRESNSAAAAESSPPQIGDAETKPLLPEADFENAVPVSITEDTTRHLKSDKR